MVEAMLKDCDGGFFFGEEPISSGDVSLLTNRSLKCVKP